tara:strand:- start:784 stop:1731 length:948 start_codon:yes stop_codon:yes gene_type:complete
MKFSGHETFSIREGWLHKGLELTNRDPDLWADPYVADELGIGKNMAKSLKYWLTATELCSSERVEGQKNNTRLQLTPFGKMIWDCDPYFLEDSTWWILHIQLLFSEFTTGSWSWFFNHFSFERFERSAALERLKHHLSIHMKRPPSSATIDRDLGCLLAMYSKVLPPISSDPEDAIVSPFVSLGLMTRYRNSGYYRLHREIKSIPFPVFGFAVSKFARSESGDIVPGGLEVQYAGHSGERFEESFVNLSKTENNPAKVFGLTDESLFELVQKYEGDRGSQEVSIGGLAGERTLKLTLHEPEHWLCDIYSAKESAA